MSAEKYPLTKAAGLPVRTVWIDPPDPHSSSVRATSIVDAHMIESWLAAAPVVHGGSEIPDATWWGTREDDEDIQPNYSARLVCIEPLVRDSDKSAEIGKRIAEIHRLSKEIEVLIENN